MGLHQDFRFKYESRADVVDFIIKFTDTYCVNVAGYAFLISDYSGGVFQMDISIEDFGLRTNRSGEYFEFLGVFLERLTGKFGAVEVEDQ